ncbi:MAG: Maf family protein [Steroidobacteraceae bacterium]|jgi:septum formation protein
MSSARLLLASKSPRRRTLLAQIGVPHEVLDIEVDETPRPAEAPADCALRLAAAKAIAGAAQAGCQPADVVLAADTVVVLDDRLLGKPRDREDGLAMLASLSGRSHQVLTAVAVMAAGRVESRLSRSTVTFRETTPAERERYWASGEPLDKAGGYAIQGLGAALIQRLEGSYSGVMGLPLFETAELLGPAGIDIWQEEGA